MTTDALIPKINSANKIEDVISIADFKPQFNAILKEIHPDVCSILGANDATAKMNAWKEVFENGKTYKDDCGAFKTNGYWVDFKSTEKNLAWSVENYYRLIGLNGNTSEHFKKYIPKNCETLSGGTTRLILSKGQFPYLN